MNIMNFLKTLFRPIFKSIPPHRPVDQRPIVAHLAQGNVRIQLGKYLTESDLTELAKKAYTPKQKPH